MIYIARQRYGFPGDQKVRFAIKFLIHKNNTVVVGWPPTIVWNYLLCNNNANVAPNHHHHHPLW